MKESFNVFFLLWDISRHNIHTVLHQRSFFLQNGFNTRFILTDFTYFSLGMFLNIKSFLFLIVTFILVSSIESFAVIYLLNILFSFIQVFVNYQVGCFCIVVLSRTRDSISFHKCWAGGLMNVFYVFKEKGFLLLGL